ncbi:MAG: tol-pal system protein YbgF [Nitrospirales bacterium]|nr:tol-pal system protein YbgF [Nitrospira sp.]MDR4501758.1 tol-pal system protein YbgF [Nitrospirales bacterium]
MTRCQRTYAAMLILICSLLSSGCVAQKADVVRIKRELDARITKLDKSKMDLQQAVEDANQALQEANGIIATQRAEIKGLLVARAEVMDQVTTIKDGDLLEVRGAIDQSEHHLQTVAKKMDSLGQEFMVSREGAQIREQQLHTLIEQLQQQIHQQNEVVMAQAKKLSEFQESFVDFRGVLDTVQQALVAQENKMATMNGHVESLSHDQRDNKEMAQANWEQVKQSVDSVVKAFEQVSHTLANRVDEHERTLAQITSVTAKASSVDSHAKSHSSSGAGRQASALQGLQESVASITPSPLASSQSSQASSSERDRLFERQTMSQDSFDQFDRSKLGTIQPSPLAQDSRLQEQAKASYKRNYEMLLAGNLNGAFQGFRQFLKVFPQSSLASNAQYWLGECYYGQRQYAQAIQEFERVVTHYPDSTKVPAALLKIGYSHLGLHDQKAARSMFRQLVRTYPKSRAATKAYARLTEVKPSRGDS